MRTEETKSWSAEGRTVFIWLCNTPCPLRPCISSATLNSQGASVPVVHLAEQVQNPSTKGAFSELPHYPSHRPASGQSSGCQARVMEQVRRHVSHGRLMARKVYDPGRYLGSRSRHRKCTHYGIRLDIVNGEVWYGKTWCRMMFPVSSEESDK